MSIDDYKRDLDETLTEAAMTLNDDDYAALIEWLKENWG